MNFSRVLLPLIGGFLLLAAAPGHSSRPERLPMLGDAVVPVSYDLTIAPRAFAAGKANGEETIVVDVRKPVSEISLNAARIEISSVRIDDAPALAKSYPIAQQVAFSTGGPIKPGHHTLRLRFIGNILQDAAGLWPDNLSNPAHPNLVSAFEAARARSLFPCFDEPRFRARFAVHVVAPSAYSVISNMPLASKVPDATNSAVSTFTFEQTPPIPPYLLTLDMGDFAVVRGVSAKTPIAVYIRPGQEALAQRVLANARDALDFFVTDLAEPYPMPKLDIVVASGALNDSNEGLGAITIYTEFDVSGAQFEGGIRGQQEAFSYVAMPIAQQWFGGLVGIRSWGDAWIEQGLASWAEARAEAKIHPEFSAAPPKDIDWGWNAISLWGSLAPLRSSAHDDRDPASFDKLFAGAGATSQAVLDQWNRYVGDETMRRAIKTFLHTNAGKVVTVFDFWSAFGTAEAVNYGQVWINNPGAPVVEANVFCRGGGQFAGFMQRPVRSDYMRSAKNASWPVPISTSVDGHTTWSMLRDRKINVAAGRCGDAVIVNEGLRPPYLVHHDVAYLDRIAGNSSLKSIDRTRMYRDTSTLFHSALATLPETLAAIQVESPSTPNDARLIFSAQDLQASAAALRGSKVEPKFASSMNTAIVPLLMSAGFKPDQTSARDLTRAYDALLFFPDHKLATGLIGAWRQAREAAFFGMGSFAAERYAAAAATPADFDWALAHVRNHPLYVLDVDPLYLLWGARDRTQINRIFAMLNAQHVDYLSTVWQIGQVEPAIVSAYLDEHYADILRSVLPTQQASTLALGIANGPWAARTPPQWRAFLQRTLTKRDDPAIHSAMVIIEKNWALRRRLEAQLQAVPDRVGHRI